MAADPSGPIAEVTLQTAEEERQILVAWNDTERTFPRSSLLHDLVKEQARRSPHKTAVALEDDALTYAQLDDLSDRVAARAQGARRRTRRPGGARPRPVAEKLLVAILGVLKAEAAYVPLEPSYPRERLDWILEDADAKVVIGGEGTLPWATQVARRPVFRIDALTLRRGDLRRAWRAGRRPRPPPRAWPTSSTRRAAPGDPRGS